MLPSSLSMLKRLPSLGEVLPLPSAVSKLQRVVYVSLQPMGVYVGLLLVSSALVLSALQLSAPQLEVLQRLAAYVSSQVGSQGGAWKPKRFWAGLIWERREMMEGEKEERWSIVAAKELRTVGSRRWCGVLYTVYMVEQ